MLERDRGEGVPVGFPDTFEFNPGGLAVLWAEENSRDSLFAAMQRKEAYGTSGTRPVVRFFAGWDLPDNLCDQDDFVPQGYAKGVPMGGVLDAAQGEAQAPKLAVWAMQDPGTPTAPGTPLQRVQIVKGWLEDGEVQERVVDVAGGPNDADVDLATCQRSGAGARTLCSVWTDPDFEPDEHAYYYSRILENPTCRWSQYVLQRRQGRLCEARRAPRGPSPLLLGRASPEDPGASLDVTHLVLTGEWFSPENPAH